jgi:hypothetical protein
MDREILIKIFDQVQRCMVSLTSGSGHLAGYSLLPDSFRITKEEQVEQGNKYHFSAKAFRESEFTVYDDAAPQKPEVISGSIVLDDSFSLVRDDKGRIMLEPWDCVKIPMQKQSASLRDKVKEQLLEKLLAAESIITKIFEECSFKKDEKISVLFEDIQTRLNGVKVSADAQLQYAYLEDIYVNMLVGIMDQDMLSPQDKTVLLVESIKKRIDNFDMYFEKLEKNELERPFDP